MFRTKVTFLEVFRQFAILVEEFLVTVPGPRSYFIFIEIIFCGFVPPKSFIHIKWLFDRDIWIVIYLLHLTDNLQKTTCVGGV